jgi:undecaprenyl-diphosphatase
LRLRDAVLLGAVQGCTEFLPVSSSAHLVLARRLLGQQDAPRAWDVALHLGTTAALLAVGGGREAAISLASLAEDLRRNGVQWSRYRPASRLGLSLGVATLPAVAAGALFHPHLESWTRRPGRLAATLVAGSLPMAFAELATPRREERPGAGITMPASLLMGLAQAAALAPGVSRSGATIAAGMASGLDRESATRFSFLLAVPVTVAAAVRTLPSLGPLLRRVGPASLLAGIASAFVAGLLGIGAMRRVVRADGLRPFILYRIAFAAAQCARCPAPRLRHRRTTPSRRD